MQPAQSERDWNGLMVALACIGLGGWVLYESYSYSKFAGIFPRTVAIALILGSLAWVIMVAVGIGRPSAYVHGSRWRPMALIGVGVGWGLLIPVLGFLPASVIGFVGAMLLGKFHAWSLRAWAAHLALAVVVTGLAYALFAMALNVPL